MDTIQDKIRRRRRSGRWNTRACGGYVKMFWRIREGKVMYLTLLSLPTSPFSVCKETWDMEGEMIEVFCLLFISLTLPNTCKDKKKQLFTRHLTHYNRAKRLQSRVNFLYSDVKERGRNRKSLSERNRIKRTWGGRGRSGWAMFSKLHLFLLFPLSDRCREEEEMEEEEEEEEEGDGGGGRGRRTGW